MMGWIGETIESIKSIQIRQAVTQAVTLGMIVTSALIIWKALMCFTGSESPVVVVLSGSMEPGFRRGDILFLHMSKDPIRTGEIVVFNVDHEEGRMDDIVGCQRCFRFSRMLGWTKQMAELAGGYAFVSPSSTASDYYSILRLDEGEEFPWILLQCYELHGFARMSNLEARLMKFLKS
ncbi:hypothetical protein Dimus_004401 [Dionaea muscipula]